MKLLKLLIIFIISVTAVTVHAQEDRQLRAMWISTVLNIDFPKTVGEESQKQEIITLLNRAEDLNMNAVFFQVRAMSDAFYSSELVPYSPYLNSIGEPSYDPLEFIINEAHKRNIELHAWFNPYRVSMTLTQELPADSVYYTHPQWIKTANNRYVIDPGIPEARLWVEDCIMEVVRRYDIDGVHFDDYFYYETVQSPLCDDDTFAAYGEGFSDKADWRRNNTYLLIKELSEKIRSEKSDIKFGVSPAGVWRNKKDDPEGSDTAAGLPNYDRAFADTRRWVREQLIDYITPQVYWSFDTTAAPYSTIVNWWHNETKNTNVQLYIGQALYRAEEFGIDEIIRQNAYNKETGIHGSIMFSASQTAEYYNELKQMWNEKTLIPEFKGKNLPSPKKPEVTFSNGTIRITDFDENTKYFCIFSETGKLEYTVRKTENITEISGKPDYKIASANANHNLSPLVTASDSIMWQTKLISLIPGFIFRLFKR